MKDSPVEEYEGAWVTLWLKAALQLQTEASHWVRGNTIWLSVTEHHRAEQHINKQHLTFRAVWIWCQMTAKMIILHKWMSQSVVKTNWVKLPFRNQIKGEKKPAPSGNRRRPGDNVGHFLCAKALQQTHILPAKLMPHTLHHPNPQNKNERRGNGLRKGHSSFRVTKLISVLRSRLLQIQLKSKCHRLMINSKSFMSFHFSFRLRSYRWLSASVLCFSRSRQTDSIERADLPMLTEHSPSTFQSLWAAFLSKAHPGFNFHWTQMDLGLFSHSYPSPESYSTLVWIVFNCRQ